MNVNQTGRDILIAAAMALRNNCRRRPCHCDNCTFHDPDASPSCRLNTTPPSEWLMPGEQQRVPAFEDHEVSGLLDD